MGLKIRLHPIMLPIIILLILSGNIAQYAMIFGSLLFHELGHLLIAKIVGMPIRSCVIMPYGGEIVFHSYPPVRKIHELFVALGGPCATFLLLVVSIFLPPLWSKPLMDMQIFLLCLNSLPILPLDGGKIVMLLLSKGQPTYVVRELLLVVSFVISIMAILLCFWLLPKTIYFLGIFLFIMVQLIKEWRYRKYRHAYEKYVLNRLT